MLLCLPRNQPLLRLFSPLQEETSNQSYAEILARFLCMVLRSLDDDMGYEPLTNRQRELAMELRAMLDGGTSRDLPPSTVEDILQGSFHALCVALFCRRNYDDGRNEQGREECPVYRFLVFASLRGSEHGGGFEPVSSVGPLCARLKFGIRLVVYHEYFQQQQREQQQRQQQQHAPATVAVTAADHARDLCEARIKQREKLLEFVHADKRTPFAAVHDASQIAKSVIGSGGLSGMPQIFFFFDNNCYVPLDMVVVCIYQACHGSSGRRRRTSRAFPSIARS
jgi:hypothetical protein